MSSKAYVMHALLGNAATLGIHWIYNPTFLANLAKKESLFFRKQDPKMYEEAQPSYYAYPLAEVGDVTSQGMFLYWLTAALKKNPTLTREAYGDLIYAQIKPGGEYAGYIETYGHKLIINTLNQKMKLSLPIIPMEDDHLIGFVPYIATKQKKKKKKKMQLKNIAKGWKKMQHLFFYLSPVVVTVLLNTSQLCYLKLLLQML